MSGLVKKKGAAGPGYLRRRNEARQKHGGPDVPDPSPAPGEVVIRVDACGLCGSDVHAVQNGQCAPGQILGHEFSGRIVALGADVTN